MIISETRYRRKGVRPGGAATGGAGPVRVLGPWVCLAPTVGTL